MRQIAFVVMLLMWGSALPATVYKWVDENGVTHYSDQPHPGAQKVEINAIQTYSAPPAPRTSAHDRPDEEGTPPAQAYQVCELYRPNPDEVFINVQSVTVKLRLQPALRSGDRVAIALDGKRTSPAAAEGGEFTISPVGRGEHTLMAVVEDPQGQRVCQTPSVKFHVRQASVLSPQSPLRPKPAPRP